MAAIAARAIPFLGTREDILRDDGEDGAALEELDEYR